MGEDLDRARGTPTMWQPMRMGASKRPRPSIFPAQPDLGRVDDGHRPACGMFRSLVRVRAAPSFDPACRTASNAAITLAAALFSGCLTV